MTVLDIGCGWGGMAIEIAKKLGAKLKELLYQKINLPQQKKSTRRGLNEKVTLLSRL